MCSTTGPSNIGVCSFISRGGQRRTEGGGGGGGEAEALDAVKYLCMKDFEARGDN